MIEVSKNFKDLKTFVLFFGGWWVYFTQGILGIRGIISQVLLVIMLVWSFHYFFKVIALNHKNPVLITLSYILLLYILYGGFQLLSTGAGTIAFDYVKKAMFSMTPVFGFYYLFKKLDVNENWMIIIIVMLILFGVGEYIDGVRNMEKLIADGIVKRSEDEMTISSTYRFVPILPLLFFVKKREWFKYLALFFILLFAIMGVKRGPIILCFVGTIIILWDTLKQATFRKFNISHFAILLISLVVGYVILSRVIESNDYFLYRIELMLEGDTSGRDSIYERYYNYFVSETNVIYLLFGHGADSTIRIFGTYAHNDWLEIALNQGLFGVIIYGIYYFQLIKQWRKSKANNSLYMCLALFILASFVTSILSMSINNQRVSAHICLAYCLSLVDRGLIQK